MTRPTMASDKCPTCGGTGWVNLRPWGMGEACPDCGGTGRQSEPHTKRDDPLGDVRSVILRECGQCDVTRQLLPALYAAESQWRAEREAVREWAESWLLDGFAELLFDAGALRNVADRAEADARAELDAILGEVDDG